VYAYFVFVYCCVVVIDCLDMIQLVPSFIFVAKYGNVIAFTGDCEENSENVNGF
jgi:hypothetical protein